MQRHSGIVCLIVFLSILSSACLEDLFVSTTTCTKKVNAGPGVYVTIDGKPVLTGPGGTVTYTVPEGQSCDSVVVIIPGS